jgi:hypothetical protein
MWLHRLNGNWMLDWGGFGGFGLRLWLLQIEAATGDATLVALFDDAFARSTQSYLTLARDDQSIRPCQLSG